MNEKNKIKNANAACRAARSLHWPIFIILCLLLKSCNKQSTVTHFSQNVMTIDYHIQIGDPLTKAQKEKVQTIIADTFSETDRIYNKWNPHSELSYINALPAHTPHTLSPELLHLFQKIDFFVAISKGKFDPTIEPLSQLWKAKLEQGLTPTEDEIQIIKPSIGWNRIIIKNGILTKQHSQTQIDLGGIAKGFCIDLLIDRLNKESFENVYVEWGGDIRAIGHHPLGRPWRISIKGIEKPGQSIATFDLINKAIATSGDYFQYWQINDKIIVTYSIPLHYSL